MKNIKLITILVSLCIIIACGGSDRITFPDETDSSIHETESSTSLEASIDGEEINSSSGDYAITNVSIGIFGNQLSIFVTTAKDRNEDDPGDEESYFYIQVLLDVFDLSESDEGTEFNIGEGLAGQINIDEPGDGDFEMEHLDVVSGWIEFDNLCLTVGDACHNSGVFEIVLEDDRGTISGTFDSSELIQSDT